MRLPASQSSLLCEGPHPSASSVWFIPVYTRTHSPSGFFLVGCFFFFFLTSRAVCN